MGTALQIAEHHDALDLRALARREKNGRVTSRMVAIANALDGMTRLAAAGSAGMDRQTLRDWVIRYNAEGIAGLRDQPKDHNPEKRSSSEQAILLARIFQTPNPAHDGVCAWTLADLCDFTEAHFGKRLSTSGMWGRPAAPWPVSPKSQTRPSEERSQSPGHLSKKGLLDALNTAASAHPGRTIQLWFQERPRIVAPVGPRKPPEPRVAQKGRLCHRWWLKGQRPLGRCDKRFKWAYIFGAIAPDTGEAFGLVLPKANTAAMSIYLAEFAKTLAENVQAVMVLDQAGWHGAKDLGIPDNVTLIALPPYSPELNPVERLWLYLRERFLSLRVFDDHDATDDAERIKSLYLQPWIRKVISK